MVKKIILKRFKDILWLKFAMLITLTVIIGCISSGCIKKDTVAPEIVQLTEISVRAGSTIPYKDCVYVTDNSDPNPVLTIDASSVDLSVPGEYEVVYTATDNEGNKSCLSCKVTVLEINVASDEQVEVICKAIISDILPDTSSDFVNLKIIYDYVLGLGYTSIRYSSMDDYNTNAYNYYMTGRGDCHCTAALSKVLLEYLGYKTIDIYSSSSHHWLLVSIDGGQNYYHFDPSERYGATEFEEIFMLTDAQLDAICEQYNLSSGWYERDDSSPKTSETPISWS